MSATPLPHARRHAMRRSLRSAWPIARAGIGLGLIILLALAAPLVTPADPTAMHIAERLAGSSWTHPLGTDEFGRDVLAQLLYGARVSLAVAFGSAALSAACGVLLGMLGGFFSGAVELLTLRLADVVLSFPPILLALLVVTFFGPGAVTLAIVLAILNTPNFIRITYGEVLSVKRLDYVEAMRALGAGNARILWRTVLPNILPPLLVQFSLTVSTVILLESGMSFLGLGVTPPTPDWGLMVQSARGYMNMRPMGLVWPCLALALTVFSVNQFCDALRDHFDPKSAARRFWRPGRRSRRLASAAAAQAQRAHSVSEAPGEGTDGEVLRVDALRVRVPSGTGEHTAIDDVSFAIRPGETVALVGESGSGKSLTSLSIMRLLAGEVRIHGGRILFRAAPPAAGISERAGKPLGRGARAEGAERLDLVSVSDARMRALRGDAIAMVFQEPMTSLNPVYRVGDQIIEALRAHRRLAGREARERALRMLEKVGIADPARRIDQYPHELSGGMRQRVMIALALCCDPALLIADEPTTALDVTLQAEILALLKAHQQAQQSERGAPMSVLFITHNLGVVAQIADRVVVMYAGRIVEQGPTAAIFATPRHPYTKGLLACIPDPGASAAFGCAEEGARARLTSIPGSVPMAGQLPPGCTFAPRCAMATDACRAREPELETVGLQDHASRCIRWREC